MYKNNVNICKPTLTYAYTLTYCRGQYSCLPALLRCCGVLWFWRQLLQMFRLILLHNKVTSRGFSY